VSRFSAGVLTTAGSTTLPLFSIYGSTTGRPYLNEVGIFNASSTAVSLRLVRLTTTGTRGTALTNSPMTMEDPAPAMASCYGTHTVAPTLGGDLGYRCVLGAAAGSGIVWTWPDRVMTISSAAATNGIGVIVENGTGQACQIYFVWGE
jgi:hypothetical protein